MNEISRDTAIELLSSILREKDHLVKTDTLKNVKVNVLFDSELEARFIEALRRVRSPELDVALTKEVVKGKPGYFLKIGKRSYRIEPQVKLGEKEGVVVPSTCDFVFRPARSQHELKPVAVFTDGFLYHRDRVGLDLAQRMAIVSSGRFVVWSLTWKDVGESIPWSGGLLRRLSGSREDTGGPAPAPDVDGYGLQDFKGA
jgi:DEAD/DEAH box helicase domain-containing protein